MTSDSNNNNNNQNNKNDLMLQQGGHHHHHSSYDEIDLLKLELDDESRNRNMSQSKYSDLNRQIDLFTSTADESIVKPESKYDTLIIKQNCVNETLLNQVNDAKEKLAHLSQSLKNLQTCGKECNLNMKDLIIDYNCITKGELTKEVKRFERMQIDLKSNLDRLQWRLDCESKVYYNLLDQFQKLQIELYYLQNLGDKYALRGLWLQQ